MINTRVLPSLFVFLLWLPTNALAGDELNTPTAAAKETSSFSSYFYLGAKAGQMHYQSACEPWNINCDANDLGFGGFAGYQLWEYVGFEAAYLDLGEAVGVYPESGVNQTYTGAMTGVELSLLGRLPLSEDFALFAKAGTFYWDGSNTGPRGRNTDADWAPIVGLGLEYQLSTSWVARLEYQYIDQLGSDYLGGSNGHLTTLGLSYRFGQSSAPARVTPPPTIEPVVVPPVLAAISVTMLFDFDSSALQETSLLAPVIERLKCDPQAIASIKGYTDAKGTSDYNLKLSHRRAMSVLQYLLDAGVNAKQIQLRGYGEQFPLIDNLTSVHRHDNRRVLIHIASSSSATD